MRTSNPELMASGGLPPPLVTFKGHPARWIRIRLELSLDALVLAHLGVLIVAAIYYLATQTNPSVKHWWDTTVTPAALRHDIRDVGEGVLASCFAQAIVWNPFTPNHNGTGRMFRRWQERYGIPVALAAVISAAVVGTVAFITGEGILRLLSVHSTAYRATGSIWHRTVRLWRANWQKKLLGFAAALAARRPLHVVFDAGQAYFAGRRVSAGAGVRIYHPPVFIARYNYLAEHGDSRTYPALLTYFMGIAVVLALALAGFGYYVLAYRP